MRLLLLCCALACAHAVPVRCAAQGGAPWLQHTSAHFVVDSDVPRDQAAPLVERLETLRLLDLKALLGEDVETAGRVRVVVLSRDANFRELSGDDLGGYYMNPGRGEPTIVVPLSAEPEVLAHELAHAVSFYVFPEQPHWFGEGLAQFLQTLAEPHGGRRSVGLVPKDLAWWPVGVNPVPVRELLQWEDGFDPDGMAHATSWLLYHWLWNEQGARLSRYMRRMIDGEPAAAAWGAVFPEYDPDDPRSAKAFAALDRTLSNYLLRMHFLTYAVEGNAGARFTSAPLAPADVHLLLLDVRRRWPQDPKALRRAELAEALRDDPHDAAAALELLRLDGHPGSRAEAGQDWRAWLLVAETSAGAEKEQALRKVVQLNPESAAAQGDLARLLAETGRAREALPIANRALDLAPWEPQLIGTLAEVAAHMGQCPKALALEKRALAIQPGETGAELRRLCPQ